MRDINQVQALGQRELMSFRWSDTPAFCCQDSTPFSPTPPQFQTFPPLQRELSGSRWPHSPGTRPPFWKGRLFHRCDRYQGSSPQAGFKAPATAAFQSTPPHTPECSVLHSARPRGCSPAGLVLSQLNFAHTTCSKPPPPTACLDSPQAQT